MLASIHFLRPFWFFASLPLIMLGFGILKQKSAAKTWHNICDAHLLPHLLQVHGYSKRLLPFCMIIASGVCMIIALSGPTWSKIEVPTYQQIQPRIILLDMSQDMLQEDLSPNRLARAKFKLHDLLKHQGAGQFGLIVYTSEPFIVSPLTEDNQTIDALLPSLNPDIMPIKGNKLDKAILDAKTLFSASGSRSGDVLILTSKIPSSEAVSAADEISHAGLRVSIIPILEDKKANVYFQPLAMAGRGKVISLTNDDTDINKWLKLTNIKSSFQANDMSNIQLWNDEGRWFVFIALLLLLPAFWRNWLQRINT